MADTAFVDYYALLQLSSNAEPEIIEQLYQLLVARDQLTNLESSVRGRFAQLSEAHRVLSDPATRAAFDSAFLEQREKPDSPSSLKEFADSIYGESDRRTGILCKLYSRRCANNDRPGMSMLDFESQVSFSREQLVFTIWYLQSKGLIQRGESSDYAITAEGVDYLEQHLPMAASDPLLTEQTEAPFGLPSR